MRSQPRAARALWAAGDELVATQERLLAGKADRDALRAATAAEREALAPLLDAVRGLLTGAGAGVSATVLARVEESLHAAALDQEARGDVAAGRLAKELRHVGMGAAVFVAPSPAPARGGRSAGDGTAAGKGRRSGTRGRSAGDAAAAGEEKRSVVRGRSPRDRDEGARRAAREAAKQRVEAARGERAAARDAVKAAREESREAEAQAKAAVRAADAARRDADRAIAGAAQAAEREQAARDSLDAAEAALSKAREAT